MTRRGAAGAALCMHCEARGDAAQRDMVRPHLLDSIDAGMRMLERAETSSRVGPRLLHRAEHGQLAAQARVLGGQQRGLAAGLLIDDRARHDLRRRARSARRALIKLHVLVRHGSASTCRHEGPTTGNARKAS